MARDIRCLVCATAIADERVDCIKCRASHHSECFEYVGHCAVYACAPSLTKHVDIPIRADWRRIFRILSVFSFSAPAVRRRRIIDFISWHVIVFLLFCTISSYLLLVFLMFSSNCGE